jgi:hypothetical protein|tara:strand:- start:1347 stop:1622 length:276 start_codon:yes stop_codon:yes gene_type:complete
MGIFASVFTKVAFDQGGRMMSKLVCDECGTTFNCGSTPDRSCWCMNLPNMRGSYDLAGKCVCPDCLTLGKAKEITKQRKKRNIVRQQNSIR